METKTVAGAVIFHSDGRVLLVLRGRPPAMGTWSLPGGRLEAGETPEQAAVREVREETGLVVTVVRHLELFPLRDGELAFDIHEIHCAPVDEDATPIAGDDAADVRWVRPADFPSLGVTEAVQGVVARAALGRGMQ